MTKRCSHLPPLSPLVNHPETKTKKKVKKKKRENYPSLIKSGDFWYPKPKLHSPLKKTGFLPDRIMREAQQSSPPSSHVALPQHTHSHTHSHAYTSTTHIHIPHKHTHTHSHLLHAIHILIQTHVIYSHTQSHTQTYHRIHTYITHHTHICTYLTYTHTYNFQSAFLCPTFKYEISGLLGIWENVSANKRPEWTEGKKEFRGNESKLTWVNINILRWKNIATRIGIFLKKGVIRVQERPHLFEIKNR